MVNAEKIPNYSLKKLRKKVKKTKEALALLEAELKLREIESQRDAIDNLEGHLSNANASILSLGHYISMLRSKKKTKGDKP